MPGCSARIWCAARSPSSVWVGRHPDVDDGDVGLVRADLAQEVLGVTRLAGHLEAGLLEQPREALAQQHGVLGDDDPDRSGESVCVALTFAVIQESRPQERALPRRRLELEPAVERRDAVGEAAQARAAAGIGAADAVVAHLDDRMAVGAHDA